VAANCGNDAVWKCSCQTFDLVIFDLPIADLILRDFSSIGLLSELMGKNNQVPFLLITDYQTIDAAVEGIKNGAYDYVIKPLHMDELRIKVERALKHLDLKTSLERAYSILLVFIVSIPILFMFSIILGLIWAM
jgi:DNA-binding NtrC family response regulator